jgi:hypothetical protein
VGAWCLAGCRKLRAEASSLALGNSQARSGASREHRQPGTGVDFAMGLILIDGSSQEISGNDSG